jgi:hypothetical protein
MLVARTTVDKKRMLKVTVSASALKGNSEPTALATIRFLREIGIGRLQSSS